MRGAAPHRGEAAALNRGVIDLAHGLGLTVTAEGVEGPEQADALRSPQCDQAQGFYYGAALAAAEALVLSKRGYARPPRRQSYLPKSADCIQTTCCCER
jgi:EAL domain-containing protein (putative c-di-GMP-specific phosphodiesterase class I)